MRDASENIIVQLLQRLRGSCFMIWYDILLIYNVITVINGGPIKTWCQ